jgi:deoxyribose-phosphate aldolase
MIIEFYINNFYTDQEIRVILKDIKDNYKLSSILINDYHLKSAKYFFLEEKINIYVDYPLGMSNSYLRLKHIEQISNQSRIVSVQAPSNLLVNRKYDAIRKEISDIKNIIPDHTEIRYILDYRKFNHNILHRFCSILKDHNINIVYPSNGFFLDNIYDNIVASKYLEQKSNILSIFNGNIWTQEHIDLIIKSDPYGLSVAHEHSLKLLRNSNLL